VSVTTTPGTAVATTLVIHLILEQPTLCTSLAGDANSMEGYAYVPGAVLRGALIGAYLRGSGAAGSATTVAATDPTFRRFFLDGTVRYLNAYPTLERQGHRERTLPTPRSYVKPKHNNAPIVDLALPSPPGGEEGGRGTIIDEPKRVGAPFCTAAAGALVLYTPRRFAAVHIARARGRGSPETGDGAVYHYDALAAGQGFTAAIQCLGPHAEADRASLRALLERTARLSLGAARSAGYGIVRVVAMEDYAAWREAPAGDPYAGGPIVITLLSPAIIRDRWGQTSTDPDDLAAHLGLGVVSPEDVSFVAAEMVGGFNRAWGLPLPQEYALVMGSVLTIRRSNELSAVDVEARMRTLESEGIGERRVDGFGRVAVRWQHGVRQPWGVVEGDAYSAQHQGLPRSALVAPTTQDVLIRLARRRLTDALLHRASVLGARIATPKPSQLARLRAAVQMALLRMPDEGRTDLRDYLTTLRERSVTRRQFEGDTLAGKTLLSWLEARIDDNGDIWREIGHRDALGVLADQIEDRDRVLFDADTVYHYNLRLMDAVLARGLKAVQQKEDTP